MKHGRFKASVFSCPPCVGCRQLTLAWYTGYKRIVRFWKTWHMYVEPLPVFKRNRKSINCVWSGQILTFKIMTRVRTLEGSTSLPVGPAHLQAWHGSKKKASGLTPNPHPIRHHSTRAAQFSGTPTINTRILSYRHKDLSRSHSRLRHEDHLELVTPALLTAR